LPPHEAARSTASCNLRPSDRFRERGGEIRMHLVNGSIQTRVSCSAEGLTLLAAAYGSG
jgi:hypothetical protein